MYKFNLFFIISLFLIPCNYILAGDFKILINYTEGNTAKTAGRVKLQSLSIKEIILILKKAPDI